MSLGFLASKKEFTTSYTTTFSTSSSFTTSYNTSKSTTTTFGTSNTTSRSTAGAVQSTNAGHYYVLHYTGNVTANTNQTLQWGDGYYPSGTGWPGYIGTNTLFNTYYSNADGYTYYRGNYIHGGSCCGGITYTYYRVTRQGNTNTSYTTNFNTSRSTTTTYSTSKSTTTNFNTTRTTNRTTSFYA